MSDELSGDMLAPSWPNLVCFVIKSVVKFVRLSIHSYMHLCFVHNQVAFILGVGFPVSYSMIQTA